MTDAGALAFSEIDLPILSVTTGDSRFPKAGIRLEKAASLSHMVGYDFDFAPSGCALTLLVAHRVAENDLVIGRR